MVLSIKILLVNKSFFPIQFCLNVNPVMLNYRREMLVTHLLIHTFQHTLFDWLKFTWVPYQFGGTHVDFNQSKRVLKSVY